jgi:hypothetical protein
MNVFSGLANVIKLINFPAQVEQHIRRNALRLNLADRLNTANAPSDISSEACITPALGH